MIRNWTFLSALFLAVSLFFACGSDDENPPLPPVNIYEGCCDNSPVEFSLGSGKIYIPNIVTPNSDGVNDLFLPFANSEIDRIESFEILDRNDNILFTMASVVPNEASSAWDGSLSGGGVYKGAFSYSMTVFDKSGTMGTIQGNGCSFLCDTASSVIDDIGKCYFPLQHVGNGEVNPNADTGEGNCF